MHFNLECFRIECHEAEQVELGYGTVTRKKTEKMLMNIQ